MENVWRIAKTKNLLFAILFTTFGEDPDLEFNGTEWTVYYYYGQIQRLHTDPESVG